MVQRAGSPDDQPALPFSLLPSHTASDRCSPEALKAAYTAANIWRSYTFEQALANPLIRLCLQNAAEAAAKRLINQPPQPEEPCSDFFALPSVE